MNKLRTEIVTGNYKRIIYDGEALGTYQNGPGGWAVTGKRKLRTTEFQVLLDIIETRRQQLAKRIEKLEAARAEVFERQSEFK